MNVLDLIFSIIVGGLFVVATVGWATIVWWKWCIKHLVESLKASQEAVDRKHEEVFKQGE